MATDSIHYGPRPANVRRRSNQPALSPYHSPSGRGAKSFPQVSAAPRSAQKQLVARKHTASGLSNPWLLAAVVAPLVIGLSAIMIALIGGFMLFAGGRVLPNVSAGGVAVGGLTVERAQAALSQAWSSGAIAIADQGRRLPVDPALLGLTLDAAATARTADEFGRSSGGFTAAFEAVFGHADIAPTVTVNLQAARDGLSQLAPTLAQPAINAGVQFVNGLVQPRPAVTGRQMDVDATLAQFQRDPSAVLADGTLDAVMTTIQPTVTDAGPLVAAASALLASPLQIRAYDPISDESISWTLPPQQWGAWLSAQPSATSATGLALALDTSALSGYLNQQAAQLGDGRYLKLDDAVSAVESGISAGQTRSTVRVYHHDTQHVVQPGETIVTIAWDAGVPYPWLQQANPGIDSLTVGQTITIPSADHFLVHPVDYDKRIVVSISNQRAWVYENGSLKWEWAVSTGLSSSPTWPGIYQIIEHVDNAYAGNWNLWMPYFMGVYRPIPGSDFTNGFHGFPTRGGSQLLWTNDLGTRVTYGCILLSNENAETLYNWAEDGVVVQIKP